MIMKSNNSRKAKMKIEGDTKEIKKKVKKQVENFGDGEDHEGNKYQKVNKI